MPRRSVAALALLITTFLVLACGPSPEQMPADPGAQAKEFVSGAKIGDAEVNLLIGASALERTRVERISDLRDEKAAVVLVYRTFSGEGEAPLSIAPDFNEQADLYFLNKDGVVVKAYASDELRYVPFGMATEHTGRGNGSNGYSSDKPATAVLFVAAGKGAEYGLKVGEKASISPNPLSEDYLKKADPPGATLYFVKRTDGDRERDEKLSEPVKINARIAMQAEDRARGILPGEKALLMLYQKNDDSWMDQGFWLKGKEGEYSIAFLRMTQSQAGPNPMYGSIQDIVEGCEASDGSALDQPIWWPSDARVSDVQSSNAGVPIDIAGPVNAVLVLRGGKAFSERENAITAGMAIVTPPMVTRNQESFAQHGMLIEKNSFEGLTLSVKGKPFEVQIVRRAEGMARTVANPASRKQGSASVLVWDAADRVSLSNPGKSTAKVALLNDSELGTGIAANMKVEKIVELEAGAENVRPEASSRFAIALGNGVELAAGDEVKMPWQVANLRPNLRIGAFYSIKGGVKPRKVQNTVPEDAKRIWMEIANTPMTISRGLGFRESLPENQGMIFIFEGEPTTHEFWMKNCLMDIDVAFITEDFQVVRIHTMPKPAPGTPDSALELYPSDLPVKYAVEMEGGWFEANGVKELDYLWMPQPLQEE